MFPREPRSLPSLAFGITLGLCAILAVALPHAAGAASAAHKDACARALHRQFSHRPVRLTTTPPSMLTSILGVLQRPVTPVDRLPAEALAGIGPYTYSALWLGAARLLDTIGDKRYFLIPGVYDPPPPPEVCIKLEPPRVRHLSAKVRQFSPRGPLVTLEAYSPHDTGGLPFSTSTIEAGRAFGIALGEQGPTIAFYGLVPDGVASVSVTAGGAAPTTVLASNNFFLTQIPALNPDQPYTITQQWYEADGTLIKTVSMRTALHELGT
jgi:hypothetical protein